MAGCIAYSVRRCESSEECQNNLMSESSKQKIKTFLGDIQQLSPEKYQMVEAIRHLFLTTDKTLLEDFKYGGIVFNLSDALIGGIYVYKEHLSIEFSNGAEFSDAGSVLEGGGRKRRHLKLYLLSDIADKNARYYIKQACGI